MHFPEVEVETSNKEVLFSKIILKVRQFIVHRKQYYKRADSVVARPGVNQTGINTSWDATAEMHSFA